MPLQLYEPYVAIENMMAFNNQREVNHIRHFLKEYVGLKSLYL